MTGMSERKTRTGSKKGAKRHQKDQNEMFGHTSGAIWLYGTHAVLAAIANPERAVHEVRLTAQAEAGLGAQVGAALAARGGRIAPPDRAQAHDIAALLPAAAVHQGLAARVEPLANRALAEVVSAGPAGAPVVILDRVSDPHNVGAILRSSAVFGVQAIIVPSRHAPAETGALAKAASGALERVAMVRVTNLVRAMQALKDMGFWVIGLDERAPKTLADAPPPRPTALVLGGEGQGLRRLTAERCDALARLPGASIGARDFTSLNVSNAAAVALYELTRATPKSYRNTSVVP